MSAELKCVCEKRRGAKGMRGGHPVSLWSCPVHGNVFEEKPSSISLSEFQESVLWFISEEHKAGRSPDVDAISLHFNRTTSAVQAAVSILQSLNFIESAP